MSVLSEKRKKQRGKFSSPTRKSEKRTERRHNEWKIKKIHSRKANGKNKINDKNLPTSKMENIGIPPRRIRYKGPPESFARLSPCIFEYIGVLKWRVANFYRVLKWVLNSARKSNPRLVRSPIKKGIVIFDTFPRIVVV